MGRLADVIVDGLVQAGVLALVCFVLAAIWAWLGHLSGAWLQRAIGALFAFFVMAFVLNAIAIFRESTIRRARRKHSVGDRGYLDYKLEAETAMTALAPAVSELARIMGQVAPRISRHADELQKAAHSTKSQLAVSRDAAKSLDKISRRFEKELRGFEEIATSLCEGLDGWSRWIEEKSGANKSALSGFTDSLRTLIDRLEGSIAQNEAYIAVMTNTKGISRALDSALDRHIAIVQNIRKATFAMRAACAVMVSRLDALPDAPLG